MTNSKHTRHLLFVSIFSVTLCAAMLAGTTFAWLKDSISSSNNLIQSGSLDVKMEWSEEIASAERKDASLESLFPEEWEPGDIQVRYLRIENTGNLALEYELRARGEKAPEGVADCIDVYCAEGERQIVDGTELAGEQKIGTLSEVLEGEIPLMKKKILAEEAEIITIVLKMQDTLGLDYQKKPIADKFSLLLSASQCTEDGKVSDGKEVTE